jgi:Fe2+ transport system protein FeoA
MTALRFACPLCGHSFNPSAHGGCVSCPLHAGCRLVCCPNCGHSTVDPRDSRLARWAMAALARLGARGGSAAAGVEPGLAPLTSMVAPCQVRVVEIARRGGQHADRLRAYGIAAGATIEVIRQRPVTLVRVEYTELALESELAAGILVTRVTWV